MIPARPQATSGLNVRIAGFPTRIRPAFLIVMVLIGWTPGVTAAQMVIWVAVAASAVMWHELGHAIAARRLGASPTIELYGFGGLTTWQPPADPTRRQLIGVSFAGPLAGFLLGAITVLGVVIAGGTGTGDVGYFVAAVLWTNVGWGLVNLFPVLPLDGGHILAELLPGDRVARHRRAAIVSIVIGGLAMLWLLSIELVFGALILGWVVMSNLSSLSAGREASRREAVEQEARDLLTRLGQGDSSAIGEIEGLLSRLRPRSAPLRSAAIETAAAIGDRAGARALLDGSPPAEPVPPGLYALVFAAESAGREGIDELIDLLGREPSRNHARWLAIALRWGGRLDDFAPILGAVSPPVDADVLAEAAAVAEGLGNPAAAREVRSLSRG